MQMTSQRPIYLDAHATTPVAPAVFDAMRPYFTEMFGNAASRQHRYGWEAQQAVDEAREQVAGLIGATSKDVVFTSGATEANNLAIKGVLDLAGSRRHVVTVVTEHKSVLDTCKSLAARGCEVTVLPVERDGTLDLSALSDAVTDRTALVSVMAANNEIGVLSPLQEVAAIAHARGALFHTDAVQAAGRVRLDVTGADVDLASFSAHKLYGPKGVGALFVRRKGRRVALAAQIDGGGHERGMRSGTLNVAGIVGFGAAAALARTELASAGTRLLALRTRLLDGLQRRVADLVVNGTLDRRLPGNLNVSFRGIDGEALLVSLSEELAVSSGAACTAAEPSHVLKALGLSTDLALASLRFGIGRDTTEEEIDRAVACVAGTVNRLRALSPV